MTDANKTPRAITDMPDFWDTVRDAEVRFLGLDYDGTLAPFHVDPMQARPLPGVPELLRILAAGDDTELAIVSGRPVAEVMALLDNIPVTIVGSHGYEQWPADGACVTREPNPEQQQGLEQAKSLALQRGYGYKLEYKIASLAMHTRGLESELAAAMETEMVAQWGALAPRYGLECRRFNGGVEIRCTGWHKGDAVASLLDLQPNNVFAVYIGDDDTDEDAFRMVRDRGLGIKVGNPSRTTAARGFLPDCQAVEDFLRTWINYTSGQRSVR